MYWKDKNQEKEARNGPILKKESVPPYSKELMNRVHIQ